MKPGANMAMECAWITPVLSSTPKPHSIICNGVAVMIRFIDPYATRPATTAVMKAGRVMSAAIGVG